jgi:hypothetical protein
VFIPHTRASAIGVRLQFNRKVTCRFLGTDFVPVWESKSYYTIIGRASRLLLIGYPRHVFRRVRMKNAKHSQDELEVVLPEKTKPRQTVIDRQNLALTGLGMGVDCLSPSCDLLDLQIDPSRAPLEQLTMGSGYRSFKDDIQDWYKINRALHCSISTPSGLPVKMDIGINANRKSQSRLSYKCEGETVRTRTIRLAIETPTTTKGDTSKLTHRHGWFKFNRVYFSFAFRKCRLWRGSPLEGCPGFTGRKTIPKSLCQRANLIVRSSRLLFPSRPASLQ